MRTHAHPHAGWGDWGWGCWLGRLGSRGVCLRACMCTPACVMHVCASACVHACVCVYTQACVCIHVCMSALVRIRLFEVAETGGIIIIQRNNKNVGKHLFGSGNISVSCSYVSLYNKVYESVEKHK